MRRASPRFGVGQKTLSETAFTDARRQIGRCRRDRLVRSVSAVVAVDVFAPVVLGDRPDPVEKLMVTPIPREVPLQFGIRLGCNGKYATFPPSARYLTVAVGDGGSALPNGRPLCCHFAREPRRANSALNRATKSDPSVTRARLPDSGVLVRVHSGSYGAARYTSQTAMEGASRRALSVAEERSASGVYFVCPVSSPSASASARSSRSMSDLEARVLPPVAQASILAASFISSPSAVTSLRPRGKHPSHVQGRAPVQPEPQRQSGVGKVAACGDIREAVAQSSCRGYARCRGGRLGSCRLSEEKRDDAVSGVASDDAARVDDAPVRGPYETTTEREETAQSKSDAPTVTMLPDPPSESLLGDDRAALRHRHAF